MPITTIRVSVRLRFFSTTSSKLELIALKLVPVSADVSWQSVDLAVNLGKLHEGTRVASKPRTGHKQDTASAFFA